MHPKFFQKVLEQEIDDSLTCREIAEEKINQIKEFDANVKLYDQHNIDLFISSQMKFDDYIEKMNKKKYQKEENDQKKEEGFPVVKSAFIIPFKVEGKKNKGTVRIRKKKKGKKKKKKTKFAINLRFFGGKREIGLDSNAIDTALREFSEEIYGALDTKFSIDETISIFKKRLKDNNIQLVNQYNVESQGQIFLMNLDDFNIDLSIKMLENGFDHTKKQGNYTEKIDFVYADLQDIIKTKEIKGNKGYQCKVTYCDYLFFLQLKQYLVDLQKQLDGENDIVA